MQCPKCGYVMDDFAVECARCKRLAENQPASPAPPPEPPPPPPEAVAQPAVPLQHEWTWKKPSPLASAGYLFAAISLFFLPILFAPIAILMGILALAIHQDTKNGTAAILLAVVCFGLGLVASALLGAMIFQPPWR